MREGFHYPNVERSKVLQLIIDIFKKAGGPLSSNDIYELAKDRGTTLSASAIGSNIDAIRNNDGYAVSPGTRFPDGKYRYWLTAAPGWTPRWTVSHDLRVIPAGSTTATITTEQQTATHEQRYCQNPKCGKKIHHGYTCDDNDECNAEWRRSLKEAAFKTGPGELPLAK